MSLTDLMSGAGYSTLQTTALLIFMVVFFGIVLRVVLRSKSEINRQAHLPLDEDR